MINTLLKNSSCIVRKISFNGGKRISGRVSIRQFFEKGQVDRNYGFRFEGTALSKAEGLTPGCRIKLLDARLEEIQTSDGNTWTCLFICDFEIPEEVKTNEKANRR